MPFIYPSKSQWPASKDTWPTLYNQGQVNDTEATIVYAEHYNKLKDFILKAENLYSNSKLNSDGSLDRIGIKFNLTIPFTSLYKHIIQSNTVSSWPGNLFEFDVVLADDIPAYFKTYDLSNSSLKLVLDSSVLEDFDLATSSIIPSLSLTPNSSVESIPKTNLQKIQAPFNTSLFSCNANTLSFSSGYSALTINCSILSHRSNNIFATTSSANSLLVGLDILFLK